MKRLTFVFIGILAITAIAFFTQNKEEEQPEKIVKTTINKQHTSGIIN